MSIATVAKTLKHITRNILTVVEDGCNVATNPNATQADRDKFEEDWQNLGKNTESESLDNAQSEAKEAATKHLMDGGMNKAEAEQWFDHRWEKLKDLAETVRETAPKVVPEVKSGAKFMWFKVAGAVVAGGMILAGKVIGDQEEVEARIARENKVRAIQQAEQHERMRVKSITDEKNFNAMMERLAIPSAPQPIPIDPVPVAVAAPAAPEPMPIVVAAEAEEPAEVEVTTSSGTQTFTSTIGRVYQNVPQARHKIEQEASKIDHGYDHPDPNDCLARHCLGGGFHKEFTVSSPVGTAHIKY